MITKTAIHDLNYISKNFNQKCTRFQGVSSPLKIAQGMQMVKSIFTSKCIYWGGIWARSICDNDWWQLAVQNEMPSLKLGHQLYTLLLSTMLWDAKNGIHSKQDGLFLINKLKAIVYAQTEEQLIHQHSVVMGCPVTNKYPNYLEQIQTLWPRRQE